MLAVAGGWYFGTATQPVEHASIDRGKLMFPDLTAKLKDARQIEITNKGNVTVIELKNGVWGVDDRGGYPVQETKLRGLLTGLTELRLAEPRTSDPAEYADLGWRIRPRIPKVPPVCCACWTATANRSLR